METSWSSIQTNFNYNKRPNSPILSTVTFFSSIFPTCGFCFYRWHLWTFKIYFFLESAPEMCENKKMYEWEKEKAGGERNFPCVRGRKNKRMHIFPQPQTFPTSCYLSFEYYYACKTTCVFLLWSLQEKYSKNNTRHEKRTLQKTVRVSGVLNRKWDSVGSLRYARPMFHFLLCQLSLSFHCYPFHYLSLFLQLLIFSLSIKFSFLNLVSTCLHLC